MSELWRLKPENNYLEFMESEMIPEDNFIRWKELHDEFISENSWTEHDLLSALYSLSKRVQILRYNGQYVRSKYEHKLKRLEGKR